MSLDINSVAPISWPESTPRADYVYEYQYVGAVPGVAAHQLSSASDLQRLVSQTLFLRQKESRGQALGSRPPTSGLLVKLLQRGRAPLPTLEVEQEALRDAGLLDSTKDLGVYGPEVGRELPPTVDLALISRTVIAQLAARRPFAPPSLAEHSSPLLDSPLEARFLHEWVPNVLGPVAAHWFTPQAPMDALLEAGGKSVAVGTARRIDFLFYCPGAKPFAIELDGPEHVAAADVDRGRDAALRSIGIDVLRVPNTEVEAGEGPMLHKIRARCQSALDALVSGPVAIPVARAVVSCAVAAKVQFAFARAIGLGWLTPGQVWEIRLQGADTTAVAAIADVLRLLSALDRLYGGESTPSRCTVRADNETPVAFVPTGHDGEWDCTPIDHQDVAEQSVHIVVEVDVSPFHALPSGIPDIIIRSAFLPVDFAAEATPASERPPIALSSYEEARNPLTTFLRFLFRKRAFRPHQGEAVFNALRHNDCITLLPTGAGKSIIYQLAGLLMPGVTLVVDPIVALIEDQAEGLRRYGIDRAAPIVSERFSREERRDLLLRVGRGDYHFVLHTPERLQAQEFREALQTLAGLTLINLAVIDEAPLRLRLGPRLPTSLSQPSGQPAALWQGQGWAAAPVAST